MHLNVEDCRGEVYPTGRIVFLGPAWQAEWLAIGQGQNRQRQTTLATLQQIWSSDLEFFNDLTEYKEVRIGPFLKVSKMRKEIFIYPN